MVAPRQAGPLVRWLLIPVLLLAGSGTGLVAWAYSGDPRGWLPPGPHPATITFYDRNGLTLYKALDPELGQASYVPLAELPPRLLQATVATEDASFYSNPGIDPLAIARAVAQNWRSQSIVSGGSTLTQQLTRNLWMSPRERASASFWRKLREALFALRLTARLSKSQILEMYLNTAPYGHQAIGVDAAARVYFGKSARELDLAESALLAGLPQAPTANDPLEDLQSARARQRVVLSLMVKQGYLGRAEATAAAAEPIHLASAAFPIRAPHFVAYVRELLAERYHLDPATYGGLRVYTTLDLWLEDVAEATIRRNAALLADKRVTDGALVAMDPATGQILAMVGSADYFDRAIDGEVNVALAPRQPGSALKPLLYAAAFESGLITPASVLYDMPTSFLAPDGKSYAPENYDRLWHGPVSARDALANSYNLPAVRVLQMLGIPAFLNVATRAGLSTLASKQVNGLSLALGSGEVRLLDLVAAYGALADGGMGRDPVAILRVEDDQGHVLLQTPANPTRRVVSAQAAYLVTDILSDDDARAPAFGRDSVLKLSRPAAVKTGTTTDWRDNWTVGYTPDLVAGVWVGNADNRPMQDVSGISGAGPIWHDFMEAALKGRRVADFQEPKELVRQDVCLVSGLLPSRWCPNRKTELFIRGTEPTAVDDWYRPYLIDRATGLAAGPDTPADRVEERAYLVVPPALEQWARAQGVPEPPSGSESPAATASRTSRPELVLTSPAKGSVLQISPQLPLDLQKLQVRAVLSNAPAAVRVALLVDGGLMASFNMPPFSTTWQLVPGPHLFRSEALDADGRVVAAEDNAITVEAGPEGP